MTIYTYVREYINNYYVIDNPNHRELITNDRIYLAYEIQTLFPTKIFITKANGTVFEVHFENALNSAEKLLLDTLIYDHKVHGHNPGDID